MFSNRLLGVLALTALLSLFGTAAQAGCGCDHPPAEWAEIMPPFASKGKRITIHAATGNTFQVGATYTVDFAGATRDAVATLDDRIEVKVPGGAPIGPVALHVSGPGYDHVYDDSLFTRMAKPRKIRNNPGFYDAEHYKAAVGRDGTLYLALDVSRVLDPRQFLMGFLDLPLVYGADDVTIYNKDGIDLTLFTAAVEDPTQRQWGSYYGWDVEGDSGFVDTIYEQKADTDLANILAGISNVFTYWRHEFHTYKTAHEPGGTHEVDSVNGLHPDGTAHIDHYNLVIAIHGVERDPTDPQDPAKFTPLAPGLREVHLGWISFDTEVPFETQDIVTLFGDTEGPIAELLEEVELLDD